MHVHKRTPAPPVDRLDINTQHLSELGQEIDRTNETSAEELQATTLLKLRSDAEVLAGVASISLCFLCYCGLTTSLVLV